MMIVLCSYSYLPLVDTEVEWPVDLKWKNFFL